MSTRNDRGGWRERRRLALLAREETLIKAAAKLVQVLVEQQGDQDE